VRSGKPKPAGAEHRLEKALAAIASALRAARVPWMVIGGIAIIARGVRRRAAAGGGRALSAGAAPPQMGSTAEPVRDRIVALAQRGLKPQAICDRLRRRDPPPACGPTRRARRGVAGEALVAGLEIARLPCSSRLFRPSAAKGQSPSGGL
jgi:hypothetical protein